MLLRGCPVLSLLLLLRWSAVLALLRWATILLALGRWWTALLFES